MRSGCVRESWRVGVREAKREEWMGVGESVISDRQTNRHADIMNELCVFH